MRSTFKTSFFYILLLFFVHVPHALEAHTPSEAEGQSNSPEKHLSLQDECSSIDSQTEIQVKLEGYDESWNTCVNLSPTTYERLPSGAYRLKIRAKHGDRPMSQPVVCTFSTVSAWYMSWWMILIYVFSFSGLLSAIYYRKYSAQRAKLERCLQMKLQSIQSEHEKTLVQLKDKKLLDEVTFANRELSNLTIALTKKNELLNQLKHTLKTDGDLVRVQSAVKMIDNSLEDNTDWINFQEAFNNTDSDFLEKLQYKHPSLTPQDLKLCVYLRMNLSSKQIAPLLNISPRSVEMKRYRLRNKLQLERSVSLVDYILEV